jgi:hypothetical protein
LARCADDANPRKRHDRADDALRSCTAATLSIE